MKKLFIVLGFCVLNLGVLIIANPVPCIGHESPIINSTYEVYGPYKCMDPQTGIPTRNLIVCIPGAGTCWPEVCNTPCYPIMEE
jgi:hypothetical protein